jgi:dihydroneopterin triphosphate diphosphatase
MARAPFQVIVIPYRIDVTNQFQYLVFKRSDQKVWQWIAGGGEDNEKPQQTARREAYEEAGIPENSPLIQLDSISSIPVTCFTDYHLWDSNLHVIPEFSFGIEANSEIQLSNEHCKCLWLNYDTAQSYLEWDSNKTALWELNRRLQLKHKNR